MPSATAACSFMLLALASGCAAPRLATYQQQPIDSYRNVQTKNGLTATVHPILDGQESTSYFGADLPAKNTIPVYVIVQNRHPTSHFVLSRDRILLRAEQFETTSSSERTTSSAPESTAPPGDGAGDAVANQAVLALMTYPPVMIAVLVAMPFALISDQVRNNRQPNSYHLMTVELQTRTLAPGESAAGFVFFQFPVDAKLPQRWAIRLWSLRAGSDETTEFDFGFTSESRAR